MKKVVVVNEQTNSEVVLVEDGTTTSNPTSYINDSPADGFVYGRKDGDWEQIDTSSGITDVPSDNKTYGRKNSAWTEIDISGKEDKLVSQTVTGTTPSLAIVNNKYYTFGNVSKITISSYIKSVNVGSCIRFYPTVTSNVVTFPGTISAFQTQTFVANKRCIMVIKNGIAIFTQTV